MDYKNGKPLGGSADMISRRCGMGFSDGVVNIGMTFEQLRATWVAKPKRYAQNGE